MFHCLNWHTLKLFVISYIAFAVLNIGWFCYLMKDFYKEKLAGIVSMPEMGMFSHDHLLILLAWALVVKGLIIFVLPHTRSSFMHAIIGGALYGLVIAGSHQILDYVMIANWPVEVVYFSIAWKMALCAIVTCIAVYAAELCGCQEACNSCDKKRK